MRLLSSKFALLILAVGHLVVVTPSLAQQPTKLRVASVISAAWLPLWVAKDEGIFARNNLDVEIVTIQNLSTTIGALGRQFDISGATPIDMIKAGSSGLDVVGISGNTIEHLSIARCVSSPGAILASRS